MKRLARILFYASLWIFSLWIMSAEAGSQERQLESLTPDAPVRSHRMIMRKFANERERVEFLKECERRELVAVPIAGVLMSQGLACVEAVEWEE